MTEVRLQGGYMTDVVRVGETVRRSLKDNSAFVHRLLGHLEERGFDGAPRFLGIDEAGREILSYIDGIVPYDGSAHVDFRADTALVGVFQLLRRLHDFTASTDLSGSEEVVMHGDPTPRNTVYRDGNPVAFIDFDLAHPGRRLRDVAQALWQFLDMGSSESRDLAEHRRRIPMLCHAYGMDETTGLIDEIIALQTTTLVGLKQGADAGNQAFAKLIRGGALESVRRERQWVSENKAQLEASLQNNGVH